MYSTRHSTRRSATQMEWESEKGGKQTYRQLVLEKEMAAHSRILAWKALWTVEPGGIQSMGYN